MLPVHEQQAAPPIAYTSRMPETKANVGLHRGIVMLCIWQIAKVSYTLKFYPPEQVSLLIGFVHNQTD